MDANAAKTVALMLGRELREAREARGWSRAQLVGMLPSGIGDRTLLSYEHGTRHLTVVRLVELCRALGLIAVAVLLNQALQRARIHLENLVLQIDLRKLLDDKSVQVPADVSVGAEQAQREPGGDRGAGAARVRELATFVGCSHRDLANYLARFIPRLNGGGEPEGEKLSLKDSRHH